MVMWTNQKASSRRGLRYRLIGLAAASLALGLATLPVPAHAQTGGGGWVMVGAPNHSNFNAAEAMDRWDAASQTYVNVSSQRADIGSDNAACTGYWAYFASPASVQLPVNGKPGDTRTCSLAAGWNLVGNPFTDPAALPAGVTAYYLTNGGYSVQGFIPVGGSVWIYENAAASVTIVMT